MSYRVEHSKRNSISPRAYVFSIYFIYFLSICDKTALLFHENDDFSHIVKEKMEKASTEQLLGEQ